MNTQQAKNIQIKSVLDKLGYKPVKEREMERATE